MFHNGRKSIGVFINRAEQHYQREIASSLIQAAQDYDYNLAFMTAYQIRQTQSAYDSCGSILVDFAPIEDFSAVILALDTFDEPNICRKLLHDVRQRTTAPVITLRETKPDFYSVLSDANYRVADLVHYLHKERGARRIFFMGGYEGHYESRLRQDIFMETMAELGLPVPEHGIFPGDMWRKKGCEAFSHFFSNPAEPPDAIICANDFMARALCEACLEHGLRVPEDVMITGVDDEYEARSLAPGLTTISQHSPEMAREAIRMIDDILHGKERARTSVIQGKIIYRKSTDPSIPEHDSIEMSLAYFRQYKAMVEEHTQQSYFRIDMEGCREKDTFLDIIRRNLNIIGDYQDFYLCMLAERFSDKPPVFSKELLPTAEVLMAVQDKKSLAIESPAVTSLDQPASLVCDRFFPTRELLPPQACQNYPQHFYFTLLHDRENTFGYTAVSFREPTDGIREFFHDWNLTIGLNLYEYVSYHYLQYLLRETKRMSGTDFLTGLLNRQGIEEYVAANWADWEEQKTEILFFSIDLNKLKQINDTYGHREGDVAIIAVANAIRTVFPSYAAQARTGGDEFTVLLRREDNDPEELKLKVNQELSLFANQRRLPYYLSASIGYYSQTPGPDFNYEHCLRFSDQAMYREKKPTARHSQG